MPAIKKFEDLDIWQLARRLTQIIYSYTLKPGFAKDFSLKDQIKRSSGSVMDNIAEGFERGGKAEFIQFLSIAKGSAGEVQSQLYRALDYLHISKAEFDEAYQLSEEIKNKTGGLIKYLNTSDIKGIKFKDRQ